MIKLFNYDLIDFHHNNVHISRYTNDSHMTINVEHTFTTINVEQSSTVMVDIIDNIIYIIIATPDRNKKIYTLNDSFEPCLVDFYGYDYIYHDKQYLYFRDFCAQYSYNLKEGICEINRINITNDIECYVYTYYKYNFSLYIKYMQMSIRVPNQGSLCHIKYHNNGLFLYYHSKDHFTTSSLLKHDTNLRINDKPVSQMLKYETGILSLYNPNIDKSEILIKHFRPLKFSYEYKDDNVILYNRGKCIVYGKPSVSNLRFMRPQFKKIMRIFLLCLKVHGTKLPRGLKQWLMINYFQALY